MATLLAPYNNAMRIGQGFNTFTHEICINDAVVAEDESEESILQINDHSRDFQSGCSQDVTYTSRFVDNLSDIVEILNTSPALSIKSGAIRGGINGAIDTDKFKESDLNFFIQVKAVNQSRLRNDVTSFQPLPNMMKADFSRIFGDTFISGFVDGGQLDALLSIKVHDKTRIYAIKAAIELAMGRPAIPSGGSRGTTSDVQKSAEATKALPMAPKPGNAGKPAADAKTGIKSQSPWNTSTETTITVNWAGGGEIKKPDSRWTITDLLDAAIAFPDAVAKHPQKIYAVLTRYTALRSFHLQTTGISPLDYSRALVHAKGLMESYIDYKNILKQIQIVIQDAAFGLIGLEQAQTQDIPKIASADQFSQSQNSSHTVPTEKATVVDTPGSGLPEISWKAYAATIPGLVQASRDCKALMIAIIKQVDDLTENPAAVDKQPNSSKVQDPALFRQLIPVSKPKAMGLPLKTGPMPVAQPITQTPGALTTATAAAPSGPTQSTPVPALRRQSPVQPVAPNEIVKQHTGEQMPATPALPSEQTATQQTEKVEEEPATQQATGEGQKPATSALPSEQPATQQTEEGEEVPATQQATVEDTPPSDS